MSLEKSSLMLVVIASNSVLVPLQVRSNSLVPPLSHRLCTDFGTEEERRKNEGETEEKPCQKWRYWLITVNFLRENLVLSNKINTFAK